MKVIDDVLVDGPTGDESDPWDQAVAALTELDGWAELKRRGRTFDDYINGRIDGYTPAILIAQLDGDELVAAGDFDESKHPRDEKGQFSSVEEASNPKADTVPVLEATLYEGTQLLGHRLDGTTVNLGAGLPGDGAPDAFLKQDERAEAKIAIAKELSARMESSTGDLVNAVQGADTGYGTGFPNSASLLLEQGQQARVAREELAIEQHPNLQDITNEGSSNSVITVGDKDYDYDLLSRAMATVDTEDVIARLQADPNMMARQGDPSDGPAGIQWMRSSGDPDERFVTGETPAQVGWVKGDDPKVDGWIREAMVGNMVGRWAGTSNDSGAWALSLQDTARDMFNLGGTADWPDQGALQSKIDAYHAEVESVQRDFLQSMYETTQDYLRTNGIESVTLTRGFSFSDEESTPAWARDAGFNNPDAPPFTPRDEDVPLRPLSAWSPDMGTAQQFASSDDPNYGAVVVATVPAERILSTARSGLGALNEQEFVLLGGTERVTLYQGAVGVPPNPYDAFEADIIDKALHPKQVG